MGKFKVYASVLILGFILCGFQNCSDEVTFSNLPNKSTDGNNNGANIDDDNGRDLEVCDKVSCELTPLTHKPAVTTILIALGDETDSQLVVDGASAQLIAETVVRYSTPEDNPKILIVRDANNNGEDPEDTLYVKNVLLARYNTTYLEEPASGLVDADVEGYDLIWYNNPGHRMGRVETRDVLLGFKGAIILQGDDLTAGADFSLEELTGLKHIDNGTQVKCGSNTYNHDNNSGEEFRVSLDASKMPGANNSTINFRYGNDIDNSSVVREDLEVLAVARGGPESCEETRPAIVRYLKEP